MDAAPYFRIFNPATQAKRFDASGEYVRAWVPELERLESRWIHRPWDAPGETLADAGVVLGRTYPNRIVEHAEARHRALGRLRCDTGAALSAPGAWSCRATGYCVAVTT